MKQFSLKVVGAMGYIAAAAVALAIIIVFIVGFFTTLTLISDWIRK